MNTVGYVRVSTDKQAEYGVSLEAQEAKIRAMATVHGTELSEVIIDGGESVAESLDTGSAAGRLVLNIMTAVSQWEREAIAERTRDGLRHKRSQGQRIGNIRFGSRLSGDGAHLEPDPAEQQALAEIRSLRQQGETLREIAAALNHRAAHRTRRGTPWRLESVARILNVEDGRRSR
jgi:site-specific DNA recombinase